MKYGFIFPGYGAQYVGMGKDLYDNSRIVQDLFETVNSCLDKNFIKISFASSDKTISELENAYTALYLHSFSLALLLKQQGIEPSLIAGKDIGECTAVSFSGALSTPDALYMLKKYAELYSDFLKNVSVNSIRIEHVDVHEVELLCNTACTEGDDGQEVYVALYEDDRQCVVTGTVKAVKCIKTVLKEFPLAQVTEITTGGGIHSPLVDGLIKSSRGFLEKVDFHDGVLPVAMGVTGQVLKEAEKLRAGLIQHINAPVQWKKVISAFSFCDTLVILGKDQRTIQLLKKQHPEKAVIMVTTLDDINALLQQADKQTIEIIHDEK